RCDPRPVHSSRISGARRLRPRARRSVPDRRRPARRRGRRRGAGQADRAGRGPRQDHLRHPARNRRRQGARPRPAGPRRCGAVDLRRQGRGAAGGCAFRRRTQELTAPMADKEAQDPRLLRFPRLPRAARVIYARPRIFISILVGFAAFFLLPGSLRLVTRLVIAWDVFIALYLVLVYTMVFRSGLVHIKRNAALQDDGRFLIPLVTALGAFASLAAIIFELGASQHSVPGLALAT